MSDQIVQLNSSQIQACLEHCCDWPLNTINQSDTLQKIVQNLDSVCYERSLYDSWENEDQLHRALYLLCLNLLKVGALFRGKSFLKLWVTIFLPD